jgi:hypothetical protein
MSKNNTKSIVEITQEDKEVELDIEFSKELSKQTVQFNKEYDLDNKCINICADIRTYLDNSMSDKVFTSISVDIVKQLLDEIYS